MGNKQLEVQGCKVFCCPNLNLLDEKGKELNLSEGAIKKSKEMAITYLKKTYHCPKYTAIKYVLPSFIYITGVLDILNDEKVEDYRTQKQIGKAFGVTTVLVRKWTFKIAEELDITEILRNEHVGRGLRGGDIPNVLY